MEKKDDKIEIVIYENEALYINDKRISGPKPYVSQNLKFKTFNVSVEAIFSAFDLKCIEEFLQQSKLTNK